jgi:hypothetical protein
MKDVYPVLLENGFKETIAAGGVLEILCVEPVSKHHNIINGSWKFFVRQGEGNDAIRWVLVKQRNVEHRVIKTAAGVASLAMSLGAKVVSIPLEEGQSSECICGTPPDGSEQN